MEQQLCKRPSVERAHELSLFAIQGCSSNYCSIALENYYLQLARSTQQPLETKPIQHNSVLHVLTSVYYSGGHTRILERWIDSAPDVEKHSVVLLKQETDTIPDHLRSVISGKNGELVVFPIDSKISDKANRLRTLAREYEYIILHHHMHDPIPLMAFGVAEFQRPVITFNHAGHMFWIGRAATDLVLDIEETQQTITQHKRGIKHTMLVNLPYIPDRDKQLSSKAALREKLGLPQNASILISMASAYKYSNVLDFDYQGMLRQILQSRPSAIAVIIGVESNHNERWSALDTEFPDRVFLPGLLPHAEAREYLLAGDLYLDSYPCSSFTSFLDAITIGKLAAITLKTPAGMMPCLKGSDAVAETESQFREKAIQLLDDSGARNDLYNHLLSRVKTHASPDRFQSIVHEAYRQVQMIPKDETRFLPIASTTSDLDILANALSRLHSSPVKKRKKVGRFRLTKEREGIFFKSMILLGIPLYCKRLKRGRWEIRLFRTRFP